MRKTNKTIILFSIIVILLFSISSVCASEDITDTQSINDELAINEENLQDLDDNLNINGENNGYLDDDTLLNPNNDVLEDDEKPSEIYIDNRREENGDGSIDNPYNNFDAYTFINKVAINGTIHLSEGIYRYPGSYGPYNSNFKIVGERGTVINYLDSHRNSYLNFNVTVTFINITFEANGSISLDGNDFEFINCTFLNTSLVSGQYQHNYPNRDGLTDIHEAYFENCGLSDYVPIQSDNPHYFVTSYECSKFIFNNCSFDNIGCDAIVDSYGGNTDNYGRSDGIYIYNSSFTNCIINGVAKVRQLISCDIVNCSYDFPVSSDIPLVGPFYIYRTDVPLVETNLNLVANANSLVITLTDESNNPLVDYELEIVTNGKVSYDYTDENGKIVIGNLLGNCSFEITFPGDEYYGYSPCKVLRNLTFEKAKQSTELAAPNLSATYNVAKNLVVTLKSNGKALANKKVTVKVGSISKTLTTNKNGQVSIAVSGLVPKTYTASIKFAGDSDYKASSATAKVVVAKASPKISAAKKTFKVKAKTKKVTATLKNNKGKVLKSIKLTLKIGKKTYTAKTNSKGISTFKVKLTKKGTYTGTVKFAGNKYFKALSKKVKIVVKN